MMDIGAARQPTGAACNEVKVAKLETLPPAASCSCHFTGMVWPPLAELSIGRLSIGCKNPTKLYCTLWGAVAETLPMKLAPPEYDAVRFLAPTVDEVTEQLLEGRVAVHVPPLPSLTFTVPTGVPAPGAVTLTENVTV